MTPDDHARAIRELADHLGEVFFLVSVDRKTLFYLSPAYERIWGRSVQSAFDDPMSFAEAIHPEDRPAVLARIASSDRAGPAEQEYRVVRPDGELRWVWVRYGPVRGEGGEPARLAGVATDVTARKGHQASLEAKARTLASRVRDRTAELEVLLREVHHRVKNNLQLVSSLLYLQSRQLEDEGAVGILDATRDRIRTLALVHEGLYRSGDVSRVDMRAYLANLTAGLGHAFGEARPEVRLSTSVSDLRMTLDAAIPCGLLVNELVSNAFVHAFPEGRGTVHVSLAAVGDRVELSVTDDGVGFPLVLDDASGRIGLRMVRRLVDQLGGTLDVERGRGATVRVRFDDPAAPDAR